jgi:hypothetical protein
MGGYLMDSLCLEQGPVVSFCIHYDERSVFIKCRLFLE